MEGHRGKGGLEGTRGRGPLTSPIQRAARVEPWRNLRGKGAGEERRRSIDPAGEKGGGCGLPTPCSPTPALLLCKLLLIFIISMCA